VSNAAVYRICWEGGYQSLLYDLPEPDPDLWVFDGRSRLESWTMPPVYVEEPRLQIPDIWRLIGAAVLTVSESTAQLLEPFLTSSGELLPLRLPGSGRLLALNVTRDVDCMDVASLSLETMSLKPEFIAHRLPESGLFKVPIVDTTQVFHLQRDDDEDTFMQRVLRERLRGISFELVWSTQAGAQAINLLS